MTSESHTLRLATTARPGGDFVEVVRWAVALEAAGIDIIAVPEAYGIDAVSILGFLAARTERVELMAGILPIYSRTPTLTAMTAAGLDLVSGGRFTLGLGSSGPQVIEGFHGVPYNAPIGRTREVIEICRQVWRRERVEFHGKYYDLPLPPEQGTGLGRPLKLIDHPLRADIPVFVAALGDRNVELTAEVADGWLPFLYVPERAARVWAWPLAKGQAKRAPELGTLQIAAGGPFAIGAGLTGLREQARPHIALYVGGMGARGKNFYNTLARRYGFEREAEQIQDLYLDGHKDEAAARVPDALLEGSSLIGDEAYLRDRLQAHVDSGVTIFQVTPVGPDPLGDIRRLRTLVDSL